MLVKCIIFLSLCVTFIKCGCRKQESQECESICRTNDNGKMSCELRGAIILPNLSTIEASLPRVRPVIDLATKRIRDERILPDFINIIWNEFDDKCDQAISTISAIDAYTKKCSHFIIGPSCEYSVASVSRISKYVYNEGLNVITAGAYTFDFEAPKRTCDSEFHMLHRVGTLSFERIAEFMSDLMKNFNWKQGKFFYDRNGYFEVGGLATCHLLMSSVAKIFEKNQIRYSPYVLNASETSDNFTDDLRREVGNDKSSK